MDCSSPIFRLPISAKSLKSCNYIVHGDMFADRRPHRGAYFFKRSDLYKIPHELRDNLQPIKCGSCMACRLSYAKNWADRLQLESKLYKNNIFLTLTYDDDHLPECGSVSESTGEVFPYTLSKRDCQLFMKRLRNHARVRGFDGIRFFLSGEYGDRTFRPHYHVILLNCPDYFTFDWKFLKRNSNGDTLYTSALFESLWSKGFVTVGLCSPLSISYTARYALKKVSRSQQDIDGFQYPFSMMSRMPGIGKPYFDLYSDDLLKTGKVILSSKDNNYISPMPSYFVYLAKNLPIRACRFMKDHYFSNVIQRDREASSVVNVLKEERKSFNDFRNKIASATSALLLRDVEGPNIPQKAENLARELEKKHKKYVLKFSVF